MSTYENHWFDVIVECDRCHDMYDCDIQLYSVREIVLVKELVNLMITRCHNCGAESRELLITVSNEYFTAEEISRLRDRDENWVYLFRRRFDEEYGLLN